MGFRTADRNLWHSKVFFSKFDATPLLGFESLQFNAVSVGPRSFKLQEAKQHRGVGKPFRERDKAKRFVLYGLSHPIVCVTNACLILTGCDLCSLIHILGFSTNKDRINLYSILLFTCFILLSSAI